LPWKTSLEVVTTHGRHIVLEATDNTLRLVASQGFLDIDPVFASGKSPRRRESRSRFDGSSLFFA
jgi:hypothetical protein